MLLLNSTICEATRRRIRGKVARIGGTVDQLESYDGCNVTDINIVDGGFGRVLTRTWLRGGLPHVAYGVKRLIKQEVKHLLRGDKEPLDRRTIILDAHEAHKVRDLQGRFDAVISSNVVEHSPNPISFLLNLYCIVGPEGAQFHAIPHYKYTFDIYRKPTSLQHMIDDFERWVDFDDTTHNADYTQSAIEKHGWQRVFHQTYPVKYPYLHFHVFDEDNVRELFEFVFTDVITDVLKTERHSDNIVLVSNKLNPEFRKKYGAFIKSKLNLTV